MGSIPRANTPPPVIDKTLSVEGAVAESKSVGDKINNLILNPVILYENSNYTNSFPAQTISVPNLNKYNLWYFVYCSRPDSSPTKMKFPGAILGDNLNTVLGLAEVICWRDVTINRSNNTVTFGDATWYQYYNAWTTQTLNTLIVPYRLYGLK